MENGKSFLILKYRLFVSAIALAICLSTLGARAQKRTSNGSHTITLGTIFLAGLPSDEGMISVLAHELVHIADGDADSLSQLFRAVGARASSLTGLRVRDQRSEELTCDLVGEMAVQSFITTS